MRLRKCQALLITNFGTWQKMNLQTQIRIKERRQDHVQNPREQ